MTSNDILKSYSILRSQAYDAIGDILNHQEDEEMDLFDCGVTIDVVTSEDTNERREVIGVSRDEDGEINLHTKTTSDADVDAYETLMIGQVDFHELVDILRAMEDYDETEND